jgi:PKD repeat protein
MKTYIIKPKNTTLITSFTALPTSGNIPLTVLFNDTSSGNPTNWLWNFGDNSSSTVQNPSHIYTNPGIYTVKLSVTNVNSTNFLIKKNYIKVLSVINPPVTSFKATPLYGAYPLVVKFIDTSINNPTKWLWDFGDRITSTYKNPTHIYSFEGIYTVKLISSNSGGTSSLIKTEYITVFSPSNIPISIFNGTPLSGFPPLSITFTDKSENNPTNWLWDFGDNTTSTLQNPTHVYNLSGKYNVSLVSTNKAGSNKSTKLNYINVLLVQNIPVSSFYASPLTGNSPLTVSFIDTSINNPTKWLWSFGDNINSNIQYPLHIYNTSGIYNVKLTTSNNAGSNSIIKEGYITVLPQVITPIASFFATPLTGIFPLTVDFTDTSSNNPVGWSWNFGDNTSSSVQNPSHIYTISGIYTVSLTAFNNAGNNILTRVNYINVTSNTIIPYANFVATPLIVNVGNIVNFTDLSNNNPTTWLWDFGDGNTSILKNPTHTYSTLGMYYTIKLTASNAFGSNTIIKNDYIYVSSASILKSNFNATPLLGPPGVTVSFYDLSTGNPTSWLWNFGDGGTSNVKNPTHFYETSGIYSVTLTVTNFNNNDTLVINNYINITFVSLPVATFIATPLSGTNSVTTTFTDLSLGNPTIWLWNFGDGTTSNLRNPTKTYTIPGFYTVSLTATNTYGSNTLIKNSYIFVSQF